MNKNIIFLTGISLFMGKLATLRLTALFKQKICVKLCPDRPTQHVSNLDQEN